MNVPSGTTASPADPTPAIGVIEVTMSVPGKEVDINVLNYGDRPTTAFSHTPSPGTEDAHLSGNARLGPYTVTVDWPVGTDAPKIAIVP